MDDIQAFVNKKIVEKLGLEENREASLDECLKNGVVALFGEKYGDVVRSIKFGGSFELCGGTHIENTDQLRSFVIISESAISTGIRRIEALSGKNAMDYLTKQSKILKEVNELLLNPKDPIDAINKLKNQNIVSSKKIDSINNQLVKYYLSDIKENLIKLNNKKFCAIELKCSPELLKNLAFKAGDQIDNLMLILCSSHEGKAFLVCYISKNLIDSKLDAKKLLIN